MRAEGCRAWRESLGAFLLDQLGADERAAVEAHLDGCARCREEVALLAPVAAALPLADPAHVEAAPAPPRSLAYRVLRGIGAERLSRRRRRLRIGAALGAAATVAAVIAALLLAGGGSSPTAPPGGKRVAFASTPRGVEIGAELAPRPWGTEISLEVRGITPGTRCEVWLQTADGRRVPAGSFRYRYEGGSDAAALSASLKPAEAAAIAVRAGGRTFTAPVA